MVAPEIIVVAVFAAVVLTAWSPLLAIERVRALFAWPTRWVVANYLLVGAGVIVAQCLWYLGTLLLVVGTGQVTGSDAAAVVGGALAGNLAVPGIGALAALRVLPARGHWSTDGGGLSGQVALGLGVVWYAVVASVGFVLIGLGIVFANLPT